MTVRTLLGSAGQTKLVLNLVDSVFKRPGWFSGRFGVIELLLRRCESFLKSCKFRIHLRAWWDRGGNAIALRARFLFGSGFLLVRLGRGFVAERRDQRGRFQYCPKIRAVLLPI